MLGFGFVVQESYLAFESVTNQSKESQELGRLESLDSCLASRVFVRDKLFVASLLTALTLEPAVGG